MKPIQPAVASIGAIIIAVASFYSGWYYKGQPRSTTFAQRGRGSVTGGSSPGGNRFTGGRPIVGEVIHTDGTSVTVKEMDGSSKIVILSANTTFSKSDTATKDEVTMGQRIGVFGTDNSDGSVVAQNIQINPMFRGGQVER